MSSSLIKKILNNNVVIIEDDNKNEVIVMGRGIAFKKQVGDLVANEAIDKKFVLSDSVSNRFQELIVDIPIEHIQLGEEIISYAKTKLGKKLNELVYISLVDHVYTSIMRFEEGIQISNSLLWDIKLFYPDEYYVGSWALDLIEKKFGIRLPDDEAGFIALHLVNAELKRPEMSNMYQVPTIIKEVTNIVKYEFGITYDEKSVYFYRFISHLKFFAQRLVEKRIYQDSDDDLLEIVIMKYPNSYAVSEKIAKFIWDTYEYCISDEEKMYLTIHIERIVYKSN